MSEHVMRDRVIRDDRDYGRDTVVADEHPQNVLTRAVWFVAGVILVLLGFRFVLALLGANPANWFAHFIYSVTQPLVSPFFNLFNYNFIQNGASRFEVYTLIAMAIYAVIAWGITALINISRR